MSMWTKVTIMFYIKRCATAAKHEAHRRRLVQLKFYLSILQDCGAPSDLGAALRTNPRLPSPSSCTVEDLSAICSFGIYFSPHMRVRGAPVDPPRA